MITRKIPKESGIPDDFSHLAHYIAAAEEPGEKLHDFWIGNTAGLDKLEDLDFALLDIEAVRKMKPEIADKSYHFIVSFRPGEEEQLSGDELRTIAKRFVDELGFEGHQYVAGTHENTNNFHLHVAVNRVHPETLKIKSPRRDFITMAKVSRELEQELGLYQDRGMTDDDWQPGKGGQKARDFEHHTWRQSFQSYVMENKDGILAALDAAENWKDVHQALDDGWSVELKPRGNGLVFANRNNPKQSLKASALDRSCSKKALQARLGVYQGQEVSKGKEPSKRTQGRPGGRKGQRYEAKPLLSRHPSIGPLWRRFLNVRKPAHKKSTMLGRVAGNWKLWLMMEAYEDPLAMVMLVAYQEAMRAVLGPSDKQRQVPKEIEPQLTAWRQRVAWEAAPKRLTRAGTLESSIKDVEGNQVAPIRDKDAQLVGIMMLNGDGRTATIGESGLTKERQKGRSAHNDLTFG